MYIFGKAQCHYCIYRMYHLWFLISKQRALIIIVKIIKRGLREIFLLVLKAEKIGECVGLLLFFN